MASGAAFLTEKEIDNLAANAESSKIGDFSDELRKRYSNNYNKVLMYLFSHGVIKISRFSENFRDCILHADPDAAEILKRNILANGEEPSDKKQPGYLAASVPLRLLNRLRAFGFIPTDEAFSSLIKQTKLELIICSPFLEYEGLIPFDEDLTEASKRVSSVKLLTRQVDLENRSKVFAIKRLFGIFGSKLEVRDFHKASQEENYRYQIESTHSKIIVSDSQRSYIGSAEFRPNALYGNYEVGAIITGDDTKPIRDLFFLFWENARQISQNEINYLHRIIVSSSGGGYD